MKSGTPLRDLIIQRWEAMENPAFASDPAFREKTAPDRALLSREGEAACPEDDRFTETIAGILRAHGLLQKDQTVLDVGCSDGEFAAEAARTAGFVTGVEISPAMCGEAKRRAAALGLENTRFLTGDFMAFDPAEEGVPEKYDLVFACESPAANAYAGFRKIGAMSRGSVFLACPVQYEMPLIQETALSVIGGTLGEPKGRMLKFLMPFNLLCLEGLRPEAFFLRKNHRGLCPTDAMILRKLRVLWPEHDFTEEEQRKILDRIRERTVTDGAEANGFSVVCGCLLWKVKGTDSA